MSLERVILNINGVERECVCDLEKDSLAQVVRRLGLTGTKVGCGTGQCGACSLILNGEVIRSCIRKMKNVPNNSVVETIEGLGSADLPHPLQQAFVTYASIQCGFCSPGFIMSAKGLLDKNPSPTRQEVRDWFTRHNNICRCTGYKPIVDAVMAAAAVLRGDKTMADITFAEPADGHIYGTWFPKLTGLSRALGSCDYGADVAMKMPEDTWHLAVVLGRSPHARIKSMDLTEAEVMPGVARIVTARDIKGTNRLYNAPGKVRCWNQKGLEHPVLCDKTLVRYGDVVAVVVARTRDQARAAAAKVKLDIEPLPDYHTYMDAASPEAGQIHEGIPNVYQEQPLYKGDDPRPLFATAAYVAEGSFSTTRQPHLTIEPDVAQAYPQDGGVAIQCKAQYPHGNINIIADALGLPRDKVRIIMNPVGASFGYSMSSETYALVAACALVMDAPVSLVLSYDEHTHFTGKRSPVYTNARLACDKDGKFIAMDYHAGIDHGAYSDRAAGLGIKVVRFFGYPYNIPNIRGLVQTAFTNNTFGIAYRAFGSPQAYMASEQLVDMLAEKIGMDPFELRYINVARPGDLCTTSVPYREYPMQEMMEQFRPYYQAAMERAKQADTPDVRCAVGFSWGGYHVGKTPDASEVDLELNPDGSVTSYHTWADVGQGADTGALLHLHEALRPLGLRPSQIHMVRNDTKTCPDTGPAAGSRSHHAFGNAAIDAANKLMEAMRKPDGTFRTWQEMRDANIPVRYRGLHDERWSGLDPDTGHGYGAMAQNYVMFMAEVAVEVATGKVKVRHLTVMADFGKIGSYQAVLGQIWGGLSHSLGFALSEDYDDVKRHSTLLGCGVPRCNDVPDDIEVIFHEGDRPNGPQGSTGCAEGAQSCGHVAILNGIARAVGARIFTLPATPQKVKAAMEMKGQNTPHAPWNLGCELYERLAWLDAHPVKAERAAKK